VVVVVAVVVVECGGSGCISVVTRAIGGGMMVGVGRAMRLRASKLWLLGSGSER